MIDIVDLLHRNGTQILPFAEISYVYNLPINNISK